MSEQPYHWRVDHRVELSVVRGQFKATCHCGEQSSKGTNEEVEEWVSTHLEETRRNARERA